VGALRSWWEAEDQRVIGRVFGRSSGDADEPGSLEDDDAVPMTLAERARRVVAERVAAEVQERRERWESDDQRTLRDALDSAARDARQRRQHWETEYQQAVETWYAHEAQESHRLCDELDAEFQQAVRDAARDTIQRGRQLRSQWDGGMATAP
jgi:catalase